MSRYEKRKSGEVFIRVIGSGDSEIGSNAQVAVGEEGEKT